MGIIVEPIRRNVKPGSIEFKNPYLGLELLPRKTIALYNWDNDNNIESAKQGFQKGEILFGKIRLYFHKVGVAPIDGIGSSVLFVIKPFFPENFGLILATVSRKKFVEHATLTSYGTKMSRVNWDVLIEYPIALTVSGSLLKEYNSLNVNIVEAIRNYKFKNNLLKNNRDMLLQNKSKSINKSQSK